MINAVRIQIDHISQKSVISQSQSISRGKPLSNVVKIYVPLSNPSHGETEVTNSGCDLVGIVECRTWLNVSKSTVTLEQFGNIRHICHVVVRSSSA